MFVWKFLNTNRLAGAALVVPVINYWWPSFPANLTRQAYKNMLVQDQRTLWIAHHVPSLLYAWMTQKWLSTSAAIERDPRIYSNQDKEILQKVAESSVVTLVSLRNDQTFSTSHSSALTPVDK